MTERRISISEKSRWKRVHLRNDEVGYVHFTVEETELQRGCTLLEGTRPGKLGCKLSCLPPGCLLLTTSLWTWLKNQLWHFVRQPLLVTILHGSNKLANSS